MSRDELLDEAIARAKDRKDWQMVEWLRTARGASASERWYTEKIQEVEAENAKLRGMVKDALIYLSAWMGHGHPEWMVEKAHDLGIEVD